MITVLFTSDGKSMTKNFTGTADGVDKKDYDRAYLFDVIEHDPNSIFELSELLTELETVPQACVIRGVLRDGVPNTSIRRVAYDQEDGTPASFTERPQGAQWVLVDFDKIEAPAWLPADLRLAFLIDLLPSWFQDVTYHYRWSASAGIDGWKTLSCHFWFWLSEPWRSEVIRRRVDVENWEGVDPVTFDPVQIHYTARPIFINMTDPIGGDRSGLVVQSNHTVVMPPLVEPKQIKRTFVKPVTSTGFEGKFQEMLNHIGPNYHIPIRNAIRWYVGNANNPCEMELKGRLEEAITQAMPGKSPKSNYGSSYLDRSIKGAFRKF